MIMDLPKQFFKEKGEGLVWVANGTMFIFGDVNFEKILLEMLTNRSDKRCCYCNKELKNDEITVEHLYPCFFGGMTIINNIDLACEKCNNEKGALNPEEYKMWKTLGSDEERKTYYRLVIRRKETLLKNRWYDLPAGWITHIGLRKINTIRTVGQEVVKNKKYKKIKNFALKYNVLKSPIVVSKNHFMLIGTESFIVANEMGYEKVPVIWLENVTVIA